MIKLPSTVIADALFEAFQKGDKLPGASPAETLKSRISEIAAGRPVMLEVAVDLDAALTPQEMIDRAVRSTLEIPDIKPEALEALRQGYRALCTKVTNATKLIQALRTGPQDPQTLHLGLREIEVELTSREPKPSAPAST